MPVDGLQISQSYAYELKVHRTRAYELKIHRIHVDEMKDYPCGSSKSDDAIVQPVVEDPMDDDRIPVEAGAELINPHVV